MGPFAPSSLPEDLAALVRGGQRLTGRIWKVAGQVAFDGTPGRGRQGPKRPPTPSQAEYGGSIPLTRSIHGVSAKRSPRLGGETAIDAGAASVAAAAAAIDQNKVGPPAFPAVVTAIGEYAYRRSDGVLVLPLALLGP